MERRDYINLIKAALEEDLHNVGDVTSQSIFSLEENSFRLISKDSGILCGREIFEAVFKEVDPEVKLDFKFKDGDKLKPKDEIAVVSGKVSSMLIAERTALNFLSHLSGIATKTSTFVAASNGKTEILDTRKTLPGYRVLHKYAVKCGGGTNHRMGLFDLVMIKDNHADAAGGVSNAVAAVRARHGSKYGIEVETRNLEEIQEALDNRVDIIMLDNMNNELTREAVKLIAGRAKVEASGNMTLERIPGVADTGVDFISIGELTHTIKAFDFSLRKN